MEYTFWFLKSSLTVPFLFFMQIYFQFKVVWRSWRRCPFVGHFYLHTFPSPAEWACSCVASVCLKGKKRCIELFISPLSIDKIFKSFVYWLKWINEMLRLLHTVHHAIAWIIWTWLLLKKNTYRFYFGVTIMVIINRCITILNVEPFNCHAHRIVYSGVKRDFTAHRVFVAPEVKDWVLTDVWSVPH